MVVSDLRGSLISSAACPICPGVSLLCLVSRTWLGLFMHPEEGVLHWSSYREAHDEELQSHTARGAAIHGRYPSGR